MQQLSSADITRQGARLRALLPFCEILMGIAKREREDSGATSCPVSGMGFQIKFSDADAVRQDCEDGSSGLKCCRVKSSTVASTSWICRTKRMRNLDEFLRLPKRRHVPVGTREVVGVRPH